MESLRNQKGKGNWSALKRWELVDTLYSQGMKKIPCVSRGECRGGRGGARIVREGSLRGNVPDYIEKESLGKVGPEPERICANAQGTLKVKLRTEASLRFSQKGFRKKWEKEKRGTEVSLYLGGDR